MEIIRFYAEMICPRCMSASIDSKFGYMGDYTCRHCGHYWKTN